MSRWLNKFLPDKNGPDKPDRFKSNTNMSVLSVLPQGHLDQNLENILHIGTDKPDNTDRFKPDANMSVLSVFLGGPFDGDSLLHDFEERLAIAGYDGHQGPLQAQRIAYLDAFIAVLSTLPCGKNYERDWLQERIKAAQEWLIMQRLQQPE